MNFTVSMNEKEKVEESVSNVSSIDMSNESNMRASGTSTRVRSSKELANST